VGRSRGDDSVIADDEIIGGRLYGVLSGSPCQSRNTLHEVTTKFDPFVRRKPLHMHFLKSKLVIKRFGKQNGW